MKEGDYFIHPTLGPCHEPTPFDEYDDDLMHDVCEGPTLGKPVQALLLTLRQIDTTSGSFGLDKAKAFDLILPDLKALRAACKAKWEEH